jgi:hypothetical protein
MTAVAGYELAGLQSDLGDLGKWAQGSAGRLRKHKSPSAKLHQFSQYEPKIAKLYVAAKFNEGGLRR